MPIIKLNHKKKKSGVSLLEKDTSKNATSPELIKSTEDNLVIENCNIKKCNYRKIIITFFILICIYLLLIIGVKKIETVATFPGIGLNVQDLIGHVEMELEFEEINILTKDGKNINGLFLESGSGAETVYYFHGNGGPLNYFYSEIKYINDLGYNVMAYDYPGYGKSDGFPHKEIVDEYSDVFYTHVKQLKGLKDEELILWGYSVGTAVVTDFASKNIYNKLILVSPLSSRYDMSKKLFGFAMQKFLFVGDSYVSKALVTKFERPVLIIHGNKDRIVSFWQGELIFKNFSALIDTPIEVSKSFIEIDNFGHNGIIDTYGLALKGFVKDFLSEKGLDLRDDYYLLTESNKKRLEKQNKIYGIDLLSDDSIQKFVTSSKSFDDKSYLPANLEKIGSDYIYDTKGGRQILRKEANLALQNMGSKFIEDFNKKLSVVSAYRSYNYQKGIKDRGCPDNLCAKAGFSEHQSGLAVDLWEASSDYAWKNNPTLSKYYDWFNENAHTYGFHNTYQRGLETDGYEIEPWHWRYLGVELSTYLKENNLTIAEYYNKKD